jgi:hypothetical protein
MERTMLIIAGAFFSILFFGLMMNTIFTKTRESETGSFKTIESAQYNGTLIVSWEADVPSDGVVRYLLNGTESVERDTAFKATHRVVLDSIPMEFYITACDLRGKCWQSGNISSG